MFWVMGVEDVPGNFVAVFPGKINVEVRRGAAFGVHEPLEVEV
jgi:hypothetical protein